MSGTRTRANDKYRVRQNKTQLRIAKWNIHRTKTQKQKKNQIKSNKRWSKCNYEYVWTKCKKEMQSKWKQSIYTHGLDEHRGKQQAAHTSPAKQYLILKSAFKSFFVVVVSNWVISNQYIICITCGASTSLICSFFCIRSAFYVWLFFFSYVFHIFHSTLLLLQVFFCTDEKLTGQ